MSDRQSKIAATMKAGKALRRRSSPAKIPVPSSSVNMAAPIVLDCQQSTVVSSEARGLSVTIPHIPTGCSPVRPRDGRPQRPVRPNVDDSPLEVHPRVHSDFDAELLSTPPARPAMSTVGEPNLSARVLELEKILRDMANAHRTRSRSPINRSPAAEEQPRGRCPTRQRRVRLDFDSPVTVPSPQPSDVFSRLGSPVRADLSPERDPMDVNWTTLVDLGLQLSGQRRSPSPDPASHSEGLLAAATPSRDKCFFPPSKGVMDSIHKAYSLFTADAEEDCRPESLPSEASTQVNANKFAKTFNVKFHGKTSFPLSAQSARPSSEEQSYLRSRAEPAVPIARLTEPETLLRRSIRAISTLDWLLNTLKEVSRLPHQDETVLDALWYNVQKTLGFCTDFTTGAFLSTLVARREAFVKACDTLKVPRRVHTWAALRPPFSSGRPSLLGDTGDVFRAAAREERELAIVNSLSSGRQNSQQQRNASSYSSGNSRRGRNDAPRGARVSSVVSRPQASNQRGRGKDSGSSSTSRRGGSNNRQ